MSWSLIQDLMTGVLALNDWLKVMLARRCKRNVVATSKLDKSVIALNRWLKVRLAALRVAVTGCNVAESV